AQPDRLERLRRERFSRVAGPEAVPVAGDDGEARDAGVAHEVVDLAALDVGVAEVAAPHVREPARPGHRQAGGQVLRIGAPVERAQGVAPYLPGSRRAAQ